MSIRVANFSGNFMKLFFLNPNLSKKAVKKHEFEILLLREKKFSEIHQHKSKSRSENPNVHVAISKGPG